LSSEIGIIDRGATANEALKDIKDTMGSSRVKDEIFTRCRVILGDRELGERFEGALFKIFDGKTDDLIKLITDEYTRGTKISKEVIKGIVFGNYTLPDDDDEGGGRGVGGKEKEIDIDD
jgi:hypothetical protein